MAETIEMEMDLSDGEETKAVAHVPATIVPPFSVSKYEGAAVVPAHGNLAGALEKGKEVDCHELLSGYIFMCNGKTKPDCYRYRVFGLPKGRKNVVENIKPGMKLFLYDFERRLLYGIYEATIGGKLNIEPDAFGRKFPAQVGFGIVKNCYPLPESTFKPVILENYQGAKFKQELNPHQVMRLLSLFRSFTAPELDFVSPRLASTSLQSEVKLLGLENPLHPETKELSFEERYIAARQLKLASSGLDHSYVRHAEPWRHSHMAASVRHSYPGQTNNANPPREPPSMSNLNMQCYPPETRLQHLIREPLQSSIRDPQLKYLTILSNIRRYGADPERVTSENEYNSAMSSGHEHYSPVSSGHGYYPSASLGNEIPSISSESGNGYYASTSSVQQSEISSTNYYHQQASSASNARLSMQSDMLAVGLVSQSHSGTTGYLPPTHGQAVGSLSQPPVEAIGYAQQPHSGAITHTPQSHPVAVVDNTNSYAGATEHTQHQQVGAIEYTPQSHPVAMVGNTQSYVGATAYSQKHQVGAIVYTSQSHLLDMMDNTQLSAGAAEYTQPHYFGTIGYTPQSHPGAMVDNTQPYGGAAPYTQQHTGTMGYAPQMHTEAVGYTQQPVEPLAAAVGVSGTTNWDVFNGSYPGATDWNTVNQYYYSNAAGVTTAHNQTC